MRLNILKTFLLLGALSAILVSIGAALGPGAMTLFIGLMFFKVPSGLCVYFITSSLWGVLERKVFPKPKLPPGLQEKKSDAAGKSGGEKTGANGAARQAARLKKEKGRR